MCGVDGFVSGIVCGGLACLLLARVVAVAGWGNDKCNMAGCCVMQHPAICCNGYRPACRASGISGVAGGGQNSLVKWKRMCLKSFCAICST